MNIFNQSVLSAIGQKLIAENKTVSVAEEVTAGFLQLAFSQIENSSLFFKGGITVVNIEDAAAKLGLKGKTNRSCPELIQEIVEMAALKVSDIFKSDWAIGAAGFVVPKRGSGFKLFVDYTLCYDHQIMLTDRFEIENGTEISAAKVSFAEHILDHFKRTIEKTPRLNVSIFVQII